MLAVMATVAATLPRWWCGRDAGALFEGSSPQIDGLARGVATAIVSGVDANAFGTGSSRFDAEWFVVTHQMAALGLGQWALAHRERRAEVTSVIARCVERLQSPHATRFGKDAWGVAGFDDLASSRGHAYLGYTNLAFGMLRLLEPAHPVTALHDRVTAALARRLGAASTGVIETYPGEIYPPDVIAVAVSIALHARATGSDHRRMLDPWWRTFSALYVDPESGLLVQAVGPDGAGVGRASGTALAAYLLGLVDRSRSLALYRALARRQHRTLLGFGGVREYPSAVENAGDIDSGPLVLGISASASAFTIGGARLHGDREVFTELMRSAYLFGVPVERDDTLGFVWGGALGNAVLLAMLTAEEMRP